ncbi:MAG: redoxin domain-containing protein [Fimbriimonas ginsengisoli]|uniref:Redoxin domain-containing protein n=1 Tax=Fimbriimonas ginsengisoli TaxID=1005039 RepID=A0A931PWM0_FIMGI|nr:redoxin domain-containing protein [Fimbriimonas ginsengisoli]
MRIAWIALPASLLLAGAGLWMGLHARPSFRDFTLEARHRFTPQMERAAADKAHASAPGLDAVDAAGHPLKLVGLTGHGSTFLVFIKDGCPCSSDAQPFFNRFFEAYGAKVAFAGVIDVESAPAARWAADHTMAYPIVPDYRLKVVRAYGAVSSAYSALIGHDGKIVRMWPGYSRAILTDINKKLSAAAGMPERPIDFSVAPTEPATGCSFSEVLPPSG